MRAAVAAIWLGACWTGPAQQTAPPAVAEPRPAHKLTVKLQRTPCFGRCPTYTLLVHGDGRIEWDGAEHVAAVGHRERRLAPRAIDQLNHAIERARFFERDDFGQLPIAPNCTTNGTTRSCSFEMSASICSDTSHSIITVMRDGDAHKIDNAHCGGRDVIDELEDEILRVARVDDWIGS